MKTEGISRIDLSDLNATHYINNKTYKNMNAADQILHNEGRALYLSASLLGDTLAEKHEALEQIVDLALKHLSVTQ